MSTFDKKALSERDICTKNTTHALQNADWDLMRQLGEELTSMQGHVLVQGKVAKRKVTQRKDEAAARALANVALRATSNSTGIFQVELLC